MMSGECNTKNWLVSAAALAVVLFGYDFYVHGTLLKDMYEQTKSLWRPEAEMKAFFPWCLTPTIVLALLLSCAYGCWRKGQNMGAVGSPACPYKKSILGFGLWVGVFMGTMMASSYLYLPIPAKLAQLWFAAGLGKGIVAALVLSFVAGKCAPEVKTKKGK